MNINLNQAYILIDKFHTGQARKEELLILESWKKDSSHNQKIFSESIALLESMDMIKDWNRFDINHGWENVLPKLKTRHLKLRYWASVAAIFLLFSLVGLWNYGYLGSPASELAYIDGTELKYTTLKDGSELVLSNDARIYTHDFKSDSRNLRTQGSYFINVHHNPDSPFKIQTSKGEISVMGTSFQVEDSGNELGIWVRDGQVAIKLDNGSKYELSKNEFLKYTDDRVEVQKINNYDWDLFSASYKDQSINDVIKDLTGKFNNLIIDEKSIDESCPVTSKFRQFTLLEVLDELSLIISLDYTIKEGTIVVKEVTCQ